MGFALAHVGWKSFSGSCIYGIEDLGKKHCVMSIVGDLKVHISGVGSEHERRGKGLHTSIFLLAFSFLGWYHIRREEQKILSKDIKATDCSYLIAGRNSIGKSTAISKSILTLKPIPRFIKRCKNSSTDHPLLCRGSGR